VQHGDEREDQAVADRREQEIPARIEAGADRGRRELRETRDPCPDRGLPACFVLARFV